MKLTKSQLKEIIREEIAIVSESVHKTTYANFIKGIHNYQKGNIEKSQLITLFNGLTHSVQKRVKPLLNKVLSENVKNNKK
jgi:hypothetical protein